MALAIGNKTADLATPAITTRTFSHNMSTGSNGYLFLIIATDSVSSFSGVTYAGSAMTKLGEQTTTTTGDRWTFWGLAAPATGVNNVVITFLAAPFNPVSTLAVSVTGCAGGGNIVFDDTAASTNSTNITVSANSIILAGLIGGNNVGHVITLDGSSRTLEFTHNINNYHSTALSATGLTAGSKSVSVAGNTDVAGYYLEIKEASSSVNSSAAFMLLTR